MPKTAPELPSLPSIPKFKMPSAPELPTLPSLPSPSDLLPGPTGDLTLPSPSALLPTGGDKYSFKMPDLGKLPTESPVAAKTAFSSPPGLGQEIEEAGRVRKEEAFPTPSTPDGRVPTPVYPNGIPVV